MFVVSMPNNLTSGENAKPIVWRDNPIKVVTISRN